LPKEQTDAFVCRRPEDGRASAAYSTTVDLWCEYDIAGCASFKQSLAQQTPQEFIDFARPRLLQGTEAGFLYR
jgi:hypothetical protein